MGVPLDPWKVWNGQLRNDPTWAGQESLIYIGARSNFTGYRDLLVYDQDGTVSDILRFWNSATDTRYTWTIFYCSNTNGGALADTGLPDSTTWNVIDSVTENLDGIFYWTSSLSGNEFQGFSEAPVPEPATMLLLGSGLIGLAGYGRKKFFKK